VLTLHRPSGLTKADRDFARQISRAIDPARVPKNERPPEILRLLGPDARPEIASRLVSRDKTLQLIVAQLSTSFVSPSSARAVAWIEQRMKTLQPPPGLKIESTGDAVIGRDYMRSVQKSLDRAALATVFLLLAVLLFVYRSLLLAMVPLVTIGVGLVVSSGVLAWLALAGWPISSLVQLFLVVILFGCGT